ncbi:MAG: XylB [Planctomycetes bacterium]|nr:XylB [Planctomycetota bacterium]
MPTILLGIEAGTGVVKACAFTPDGDVVGKAQRPVPIATPHPTWAELDLETYWQAVLYAAREAVRGLGDVTAVGIAATCPTTVFLDDQFRPLRPGILYLDRRSDEYVRRFAEAHGGPEAVLRRTGNHPYSSTCWLGNAAWLREREPAMWARTRHIGLLGSFLLYRLTGAFVVDWTQACYSGGFDSHRPEAGWQTDLLAGWGVEERQLAELRPPYQPCGRVRPEVADDLGSAQGAVVAAGASDTAAAAFAVGLRDRGEVLETSGTSGVVTFCLDRPDFDGAFMNRCHVFPGRWLAHGAMSTLGGAFAWCRNKIWPDTVSVAELEKLAAESPAGANGLIFLPYLAGERSPIWDPDASGVWIGLRLDSTRADMIRAVFEGAAYGLRQMMERAAAQWHLQPTRVLSVGSGSRSRFWVQIKREVMGIEYDVSEKPDAAAWGAALLGGIAAGVYTGPDDAAIPFLIANRKPPATSRSERMRLNDRERKRAYDRAFAIYEKLYPALREAMHDLSQPLPPAEPSADQK